MVAKLALFQDLISTKRHFIDLTAGRFTFMWIGAVIRFLNTFLALCLYFTVDGTNKYF